MGGTSSGGGAAAGPPFRSASTGSPAVSFSFSTDFHFSLSSLLFCLELNTASAETTPQPKPAGTARRSIALVFFCTLLGAAAQILMKIGSTHASTNLLQWLTNVPLIAGYAFYGAFTLLMVVALREGELSMLYPIISLTYVWVTLLSYTLLGEHPNLYKNIGITVIVIGVAVLGRGGRK